MEFHSQQEVCPSGMGWLWWGLEGAGSKINAAVPASQSGGVVGGGGGRSYQIPEAHQFLFTKGA